jgi:phosphatidylinositol-3-phosphatase
MRRLAASTRTARLYPAPPAADRAARPLRVRGTVPGVRRLLLALGCIAGAVLGPAATARAALPPVRHVFVIVLENESAEATYGPASPAPYLSRTLRGQGEFLPNYYAIGHESLDNYLAMISGQAPNAVTQADCQIYQDVLPGTLGPGGQAIGQGCVYPSAVKTVADQLAARGLSWKGYMEDMGNSLTGPPTCRHPAFGAPDDTQRARAGDEYAARHNPFVYFHSIIDSPACAANDVPLDRLPADLASARTTPTLAFITPNLCHDGHDSPCVDGEPGGLASADAFLRAWVPRIVRSPAYRDGGLLAITFDESDGSDSTACCGEQPGPGSPDPGGPTPGPGGGRVGAVLLSPFVEPGTTNLTPYNHYSFLRSIEDLFGLAHLGYAGQSGLRAFGADVFNRAAPSAPAPPARAPRPRIRLGGLPRRCVARGVTLTVSVRPRRTVRRVTVALGGRRIASSRRARLHVRVPARALRHGARSLRVRVVARSGRAATVRRTLRPCASLRAAPRLTG